MPALDYVEAMLGFLLSGYKGHDSQLLVHSKGFSGHNVSTITVNSPECGPTHSPLQECHSSEGGGKMPSIAWSLPDPALTVAQYLVIIEDPDAPLPGPILHGLFYGLSPSKKSISASDLTRTGKGNALQGGFNYGRDRRGSVSKGTAISMPVAQSS